MAKKPLDKKWWQRRSSDNGREVRSEKQPSRKGFVITVCLLISIVLWFTLTMREVYSVEVEMPTRVVNLPSDQALTSLPPTEVDVQVEGEGFELLQLFYDLPHIPISAEEDEADLQSALYTVPSLNKDVNVTSINPPAVVLQKEERVTRTLPVQVKVNLQVPSTHDLLDSLQVTPDSVEVSGAASIVGNLKAWPTVSRTFEDVRDSLRVRIPLSDTLRGLVQLGTGAVTLSAVAAQFTEGTRDVNVIVRSAPSGEEAVTLEQPTVRVSYRVPLSQYAEAMQAPDFFATVSYEEIRSDNTGRIQPAINLPSGILLRDVEMTPPTLRYYTVLVDE